MIERQVRDRSTALPANLSLERATGGHQGLADVFQWTAPSERGHPYISPRLVTFVIRKQESCAILRTHLILVRRSKAQRATWASRSCNKKSPCDSLFEDRSVRVRAKYHNHRANAGCQSRRDLDSDALLTRDAYQKLTTTTS